MSTDERFHIRDARDDERAAVRELTLAAYAEYATIMTESSWVALREVLHAALDEDAAAQLIVAERDGALVGSVMLYPPAANAYGELLAGAGAPELRLLAVLPAARGIGVGEALVEECVRRAERMGATELGLHTSDSMQVAMRMYERMGFVRVPDDDFRPPGAELVMAYRRSLIR
jgi:GNAT superfamily N-acetyltransferase